MTCCDQASTEVTQLKEASKAPALQSVLEKITYLFGQLQGEEGQTQVLQHLLEHVTKPVHRTLLSYIGHHEGTTVQETCEWLPEVRDVA